MDGCSVIFLCFKLILLRDFKKNPKLKKLYWYQLPEVWVIWNAYFYLSIKSPIPPPLPPTTTNLPFTDKDVFKVTVLSWVVYSSEIICELTVASVREKIIIDLIKHFKHCFLAFWLRSSVILNRLGQVAKTIREFAKDNLNFSYFLFNGSYYVNSIRYYCLEMVSLYWNNLKCIHSLNKGT